MEEGLTRMQNKTMTDNTRDFSRNPACKSVFSRADSIHQRQKHDLRLEARHNSADGGNMIQGCAASTHSL